MLFGFPLRPNMDTTFYAPERSINIPYAEGDDGEPQADVPGIDIPGGVPGGDEDAVPLAWRRGTFGITWSLGDEEDEFGNNDPQGNTWVMQMSRPMKAFGPSMLFIEVHTTGVKCRSLSHDNEKACWSLNVNSNLWLSAKSNNGCRICFEGDADDAVAGDIREFYPKGLDYRGAQQWRPNPVI